MNGKETWVTAVLELPRREPGSVLVVEGEPAPRGKYFAGVRFKPVTTLLEAVQRIAEKAGYDQIVALTGENEGHLPALKLGSDRALGECPLIVRLRGPEAPPCASEPAPERLPWEDERDWEQTMTTRAAQQILWQGIGSSYLDRLERFDAAWSEPQHGAGRTVLLVDFRFLMPSAHEVESLLQSLGNPESLVRISRIRTRFSGTREIADSRAVDVVLFGEHPLVEYLLEESPASSLASAEARPSVLASVISGFFPDLARQYEAVLKVLPPLSLGPAARLVRAPRARDALDSPLLTLEDPAAADDLYRALRSATLRKGKVPPCRPLHPEQILLSYWAELDVEGFEQVLADKVIGQDEAKRVILSELRRMRDNCAQLYESNPDAVRTAADDDFLPPIFGFFGAAGMGKTTICDLLIEHLLGDQTLGMRIDMAGKSVDVVTHGTRSPMIGSDVPGELMTWWERTFGLGVVGFDEFNAFRTENHKPIADGLDVFRQLLQDRRLTPANPRFNPPGRYLHFANTIFVFSGNVARDGSVPAGFVAEEALGPAFLRRCRSRAYFTTLAPEELEETCCRAAKAAAKAWSEAMERTLPGSIVIAPELRAILARDARKLWEADPTKLSFSEMLSSYRGMNFGKALEAQPGQDTLVLDPSILPGAQPSPGARR